MTHKTNVIVTPETPSDEAGNPLRSIKMALACVPFVGAHIALPIDSVPGIVYHARVTKITIPTYGAPIEAEVKCTTKMWKRAYKAAAGS